MRITDERLTAFINSLDTGNPAYLNELEKEARETNVPIIRTETQSLLRTLIVVNRPERILEVGTAVGFSALCMSEYAPEGCQITTIEKYEKKDFRGAGEFQEIREKRMYSAACRRCGCGAEEIEGQL